MKTKEKPLYDSSGRWVEERGRIKGAIRRAFRLSPQMREILQAARVELPPALKKDGTSGKRNQVRYRCAICGDLFSQKNVQVDHVVPVVPLWKNEADMSYDELVRGVFCSVSNLQVICSTPLKANNNLPSCHRQKTNEENFIRSYLLKIENESIRKDRISEARTEYKKHLEIQELKKQEKKKRKEDRLLKKQNKSKKHLQT